MMPSWIDYTFKSILSTQYGKMVLSGLLPCMTSEEEIEFYDSCSFTLRQFIFSPQQKHCQNYYL